MTIRVHAIACVDKSCVFEAMIEVPKGCESNALAKCIAKADPQALWPTEYHWVTQLHTIVDTLYSGARWSSSIYYADPVKIEVDPATHQTYRQRV